MSFWPPADVLQAVKGSFKRVWVRPGSAEVVVFRISFKFLGRRRREREKGQKERGKE